LSTTSLRSLWVKFSNPGLFELSDEELMTKTAEDDQKSFCVLYERYKERIFQYLVWNTGSKARSEELMQDVFLKIYLNRRQYRPQSFKGWIYTIARNILIDWSRKKTERLFENEESYEKYAVEDLLEVDEALILRQNKKELLEAIEDLSPRLKEAITLWMTEEWSTEEMAEILQCSAQAVKNLIHRAKRELVEYFDEPTPASSRRRR
jgi:RNA polymerase sigma factor (sigma-70 family)